ncbi:hypothetical protein NGB58_27355, partial [Escherichia coli]|nr:hypothetical protein [Escherichia coli]
VWQHTDMNQTPGKTGKLVQRFCTGPRKKTAGTRKLKQRSTTEVKLKQTRRWVAASAPGGDLQGKQRGA